MNKKVVLIISLIMVFSLVACSGNYIPSSPVSNTTDSNTSRQDNSDATDESTLQQDDKDIYPRNTCFDETGYRAAANLQNCHIFYTYDDMCDGNSATKLTGEYMTCLNRLYFCTYSPYGYGRHVKGDTEYSEPDNHRAFVFKDGVWTIYDFYRKVITTGGEPEYVCNEWSDDSNMTSFSNNTIRYWELYTKDYQDAESNDFYTEHIDSIEGKTICGKPCDGWMRYETYEDASSYDYCLWVDPETEFTLRYEWYVDQRDLSDVGRIFEVTSFELNCVTYEDFDQKIADLVESFGGESKFEQMSWNEYMEFII